ncbi:hypothetical protein [Flavivirga eckloniae]|uniref:DUF4625 domain-containing protein n=1 Tax=Flavivirga eckloniae TaxID=1803846 RepID=A0A2K9PTN2_9FLAO|nr:hypothetical protein [Flavivirga eckloniae]AUP80178.1 hypothetical protein C1H87_16265 [Flavivirga eckloniae]
MKKYTFILLTLFFLGITACEDQKIGFLTTEFALYDPNGIVINYANADQQRIDNDVPWVTLPIQGIQGTAPILMSIYDVKSETTFDLEKFKEEVTVRGNGVIQVPLNNTIPPGSYLISLKVDNEGYSDIVPDVFTIIIE